ncbi:MAG: hypothetical protein AAGF85_02370 [Bacteroidota bacterium]
MKNRNTVFAAFFTATFFIATGLVAQDSGFIYGKLTTIDGKTYEGPMRWGKEEVYWTDMFNASKERNENIDYLSREDMRRLERFYERRNYNWGGRVASWFDSRWNYSRTDYNYTHQFSCQFGELKSLRMSGRKYVDIELQNGDKFEVDGDGYNDIGSQVKILDQEIGEMAFRWSRIDRIDFMKTPNKLDDKFGEPLHGTVETYGGTFTGYVQWDHDERVDTDKLDGDTYDGDVSIRFGKIKSIERDGNRSIVVMNSGREMELRGSNDVNSENRGIIVTTEFGRVDIPWREFKRVTFDDKGGKMKSYTDYTSQKELTGMVKTVDGDTFSGRIVYDLDETFDYEVLQGKDDDIEYIIPFRYIKTITPKNYDNSNVILKSGEKLFLGDAQDVSDRNTGLLVFEGKGDPRYLLWNDIDEVTFN